MKMKLNLITNIEINSVKDLSKLRTIVEANNLDKPNFSEIARNLGIDIRTVKKHYMEKDKNRYLQREHGLNCTRNNFNYYILKHEEFHY